jgi:hypothetical protein
MAIGVKHAKINAQIPTVPFAVLHQGHARPVFQECGEMTAIQNADIAHQTNVQKLMDIVNHVQKALLGQTVLCSVMKQTAAHLFVMPRECLAINVFKDSGVNSVKRNAKKIARVVYKVQACALFAKMGTGVQTAKSNVILVIVKVAKY